MPMGTALATTLLVLAFFSLLLLPRQALAAVNVSLVGLQQGNVVGSPSQNVTVAISSILAVETVQAQMGAVELDLAFSETISPGSEFWAGTLSLASLAPGIYTLTVTATDVDDDVGSAEVTLVYDVPPALAITSPERWTVSQDGHVTAAATCASSNPGGCTSLAVYWAPDTTTTLEGATPLASGSSSINEAIDLSAHNPSAGLLAFVASDTYTNVDGSTAHQLNVAYVEVDIDFSPTLSRLETVHGQILDADCGRLLLLDPDGTTAKLYDRATQQYTVIATNLPLNSSYGLTGYALTPTGALLATYNPEIDTVFPFSELYEWRSNQLSVLDHPDSAVSLAVSGNYAIWADDPALIFRDLTAGTNITISETAGNNSDAVAANGDVVFWDETNSQIYRWRSGVTTQLTDDSASNIYPLTDGINVVYTKWLAQSGPFSIALYGSSGEVILDPADSSAGPSPGESYQVRSGWAAYTSPWGGGEQVFVYDPQGNTHRLTQFSADSTIDAMDEAGGVMLLQGGARYFASPAIAPVQVSASAGKAALIGNEWNLMLGDSLLAIATGEDGGSSSATCGGGNGSDAAAGGLDAGGAVAEDASSFVEADATLWDDAGMDAGMTAAGEFDANIPGLADAATSEVDGTIETVFIDAALDDGTAYAIDATATNTGRDAASGGVDAAMVANDASIAAVGDAAPGGKSGQNDTGGESPGGCSVSASAAGSRWDWPAVLLGASLVLVGSRRRRQLCPATSA